MKLAVKLEPDNPEAIPIKPILDDEPFTDAIQEATAQLKTWKSNFEHRVERSFLSKWYFDSDKQEWNEELSIFCLHSALYSGGFTHYWAANLSKDNLENIIIKEIKRAKFPALKSIAYLVPSFFWNERIGILDFMEQMTTHISMKNLIPRLADFDNLKRYKRQARLYNNQPKFEGRQVRIGKLTLDDAKDLFRKIQDKESKCMLKYQERLLGHQLDIFLHTPSVGQNKSGNLLAKLRSVDGSRQLSSPDALGVEDLGKPEDTVEVVPGQPNEIKT
jgi:hypothetical protein